MRVSFASSSTSPSGAKLYSLRIQLYNNMKEAQLKRHFKPLCYCSDLNMLERGSTNKGKSIKAIICDVSNIV